MEKRARRHRHERAGVVGVALVVTFALVTAGLVVASRSDERADPLRALRVPADQLVTPARDATLAAANLPRAAAGSPDVATLVHDDTAFAFDLYHRLAAGGSDNLFLSPQSISTTLAMADEGAKSNTAAEIARALHFTLDPARLHEAFNSLNQTLLAPRPTSARTGGEPLELRIDNSLWAQRGRDFIKTFLDTLAVDYGAPVHLVDYAASPTAAVDAINAYVATQTKGRIPKLVSSDDIDTLTRFVLLNTVYFKGSWTTPFEAAGAATPFHLLDGTTVDPSMMTADETLDVAQTDAYQAVRIPYVGGASMEIIVPAAGKFDQVESQLSADLLDHIRSTATPQGVQLTMPKFSFSTSAHLDDALKALGMRDAFVPPTTAGGADFTGMSPTRDLYLKTVVHQATVAVDEQGTEATAATAAIGAAESVLLPSLSLTVDRPFLVVIEDDATHAVLFTGRVTNPNHH
jgi:serpin B